MQITFCASPKSETQKELFARAAAGLRLHGVETFQADEYPSRTENVACWGWRKGERLRCMGYNVLVFERAYLGDRFHWTSLAWNGLNGRGNFCLRPNPDPARFHQNFTLAPWKETGDIIVIMGQVPGDMSLLGQDMTGFYEEAALELERLHKKPVYFRPHPVGRNFTPRIPTLEGDLQDALDRAFLVVTYNSNSGVDAVVKGVPAISMDHGSMAWGVTGHSLSDRIMPDREQWAVTLAHCQWTPDEIDTGAYWERLKCGAAI